MTKLNDHLTYYVFLIASLAIGTMLILVFSPNKILQMSAVVGLSFVYALIGIAHHLINHDLVAKIVIEYVLVAALGIAAAFFIFKGGFGL